VKKGAEAKKEYGPEQIMAESWDIGVANNWKEANLAADLRHRPNSILAQMTESLGRQPDPRAPTPDAVARAAYHGNSTASAQGLFEHGRGPGCQVMSMKLVAAGSLSGQSEGLVRSVEERSGAGPASLSLMHDATPAAVSFENPDSLMSLAGYAEQGPPPCIL